MNDFVKGLVPQYESMVGERIRSRRQAKRMTLKDMATATGLSMGFLSQLERGVHGGSVRTLQQIAAALGVSVGDLFEIDWDEAPHVRSYESEKGYGFGEGATKIRLVPRGFKFLEVFIGIFEPGGTTGAEAYAHGDSEEFIFVLEGPVTLELGDERFDLDKYESIHYESKVLHRLVAGSEGAQVLWLISPPSY